VPTELTPTQREQLLAERLQLVDQGVHQVRGPRLLVDIALSWAAYQA